MSNGDVMKVQDDLRNSCEKFQPIRLRLGTLAVLLVFRVQISLSRKPLLRLCRPTKICGGNFETGPKIFYTIENSKAQVRKKISADLVNNCGL